MHWSVWVKLWGQSHLVNASQHLRATGEVSGVCLLRRLCRIAQNSRIQTCVRKSSEELSTLNPGSRSRSRETRRFLQRAKFEMSRRSRGCYSLQPETLTSSRDCQWIQIPLSPLYCCSYVFIRQIWQQCGVCHWPKGEGAIWLACLFFQLCPPELFFQISSVKNLKGVPGKLKSMQCISKKEIFIDLKQCAIEFRGVHHSTVCCQAGH